MHEANRAVQLRRAKPRSRIGRSAPVGPFSLVEIVATESHRERSPVEATLGIAVPDEVGALLYVFAAEVVGILVVIGALCKVVVRVACSRAARDTPSKL